MLECAGGSLAAQNARARLLGLRNGMAMSRERTTDAVGWRYPSHPDQPRDLRIDFLRGVVMVILVINHIEIFSAFNFLVWERIGVVSGGEGFVILSGVVLGMVHRRRLREAPWSDSAARLSARAFQLYRVNLFVVLSVAALSVLSFLNTEAAMTFVDRGSGTVYPLYPSADASLHHWLGSWLLLRIGPHQFQIMGLYVVLLLTAPAAIWLFQRDRAVLVLSISWILYFGNTAFPVRPTHAQFEYGFPLLTWQLPFFHGLAFGYYWKEIAAFFHGWRLLALRVLSGGLFLAFLLFTWNNPNPGFPAWYRLDFIPAGQFHDVYQAYFSKNRLGILRLVNYAVILYLGYQLLTIVWRPIYRTVGKILVPLGQASLYVFVLHVYAIILITSLPPIRELVPTYRSGSIWLTSLAHTSAILVLWLMVEKKVLYRWIPR